MNQAIAAITRRPAQLHLWLGAFALTGALGCATVSSAGQSQSSIASRALETAPSDTTFEDEVRLLDAGVEPRAPLRLHPRIGDVVQWTMAQQVDMDITVAGNVSRLSVGMVLDLETEVMNFDETTQVAVERALVTDARMVGEYEAAVVDEVLSEFIDLERWTRTDGRGRELEAAYRRHGVKTEPNGLDDLDFAALVLPEEAVGVGARWQQHDEVVRNGFRWLRVSEHELVSRNGRDITIETVSSLQPLADHGIASNGVRFAVERVDIGGRGSMSLDLGIVVPLRVQTSSEGTFEMLASGSDGSQLPVMARMSSDTRVDVRRRGAAETMDSLEARSN